MSEKYDRLRARHAGWLFNVIYMWISSQWSGGMEVEAQEEDLVHAEAILLIEGRRYVLSLKALDS
jgi:hypothetical protein